MQRDFTNTGLKLHILHEKSSEVLTADTKLEKVFCVVLRSSVILICVVDGCRRRRKTDRQPKNYNFEEHEADIQ